MFDIQAAQNRKINKLKECRSRYSKEEYPYKVILNMFYELFSVELLWDDIISAFTGNKKFKDPTQALTHIVKLKRQIQLSQVHNNLESFLTNNRTACGISYSDLKEIVYKAQNGDNHAVIEIEYSYWFYCQYAEAALEWAAYGYLGYDKHSAFTAVTGGDVGGLKLNTFKDVIQFFPTILGISLGWKDAEGNSINPMSNKDKNKKYYPDSFELLPMLWDENADSKMKSSCFIATVVYGDYNASEVVEFRKFRDDILTKTLFGRAFIYFYYLIGPFIAKFILIFKIKKFMKILLDYLLLKLKREI